MLSFIIKLARHGISCVIVFVYNGLNTLCGVFILHLLRKARGCCMHVFSSLVQNNLPWKNKLKNFIDFYKADLPNIEGLDAELDMWETWWVKESRELTQTLPKRIFDTLLSSDEDFYPNINTILNILAVVPATTCTCETAYHRDLVNKNNLQSLQL